MHMSKLILLVGSLVVAACSREQEPLSRVTTTTTSTSTSTTTTAGAPAELAWAAPSGWTDDKTGSAMRIATYKIPKATGDTEDATMAVSTAGGALDANIERWVGQFSPVTKSTRSERKVGALAVTIVEVQGTFSSGAMAPGAAAGPKTRWTLLGAIVPSGSQAYFFKMTGPEKTVDAARPAFDTFLNSLHVKGS